jgi:hypothetical protein
MDLNASHLDADGNPQVEFCTLEYRPQNWKIASSGVAPVIVLVLRDKDRGLRFLVHPELRKVVQGKDFVFIESLLLDFSERAKLHPAALLKHLCSLGVGPLVTQEAGSDISEYPPIKELSSRFLELE